MCLAQGHNAVTPVRLEQVAPPSRVKHSTNEPLRSLFQFIIGDAGLAPVIQYACFRSNPQHICLYCV